jgi:rare lipoprotein A
MALIDFVPTLLSAKRLELESHANSRRFLRCGVLLSSMAVAGWAGGDEAHARGRAARNPPPQAEDSNGNPEFYEVFGKRYKVRESSNGYRERGIASWYGRPFHGRPTSSGEKYDMEEMTAAHTSLPLPTWVEVTNLTNGKTVVVKVNDRGPFVADRLIDLSYAAAKALDIVRTGTARVEVRALDARPPEWTARAPETAPRRSTAQAGASTTQPRITTPLPAAAPAVAATPAPAKPPLDLVAAATPQPAPLGQDERLFAQAGKFKQRSDAVELVAELKSQGLVNAFIVTEDGRRNSVHRVRIGPLPDSSAVKRMNDQLRDLGAKRSRSVVMN